MASYCLNQLPTGETVLLVEPDVLIRRAAGSYLRERGLRVIEAVDVAEAKEVLGSEVRVDVVIVDVATLGDAFSFELANWSRVQRDGVRLVLVPSVRGLTEESEQLHFGAVTRGSFAVALLAQQLRQLVDRHARQRRQRESKR